MESDTKAYIAREGGKLASSLVRVVIARSRKHRIEPPETSEEASVTVEEVVISPEPVTTPKQGTVATACVPCAAGHYGTCSGLLNEAMRFAKKDGIGSSEVIDRVNMCMDELNAMERVDLRPEVIVNLPEWEKELANKALTGSRSLRHGLESLGNIDDLEKVAATTQTTRNEIGREWFKHRLSSMSEEEKAKTIERAAEEGLSSNDKERIRKRAEELIEEA